MVIRFKDLIASTPDEAYRASHIIKDLAAKTQARQLVILDSIATPLIDEEYPVFPGQTGLYTGNPNWYNKILDILEHLGEQLKQVKKVCFYGLQNEYEQICRGIQQIQAEGELPVDIEIQYIHLDMETTRLGEKINKVEHQIAQAEATMQADTHALPADEMVDLERFISEEFNRIDSESAQATAEAATTDSNHGS